MSTPMKRRITTEKIIKSNPDIAEVMICFPSLIFSGLPDEKRMVRPPQRDSKKAKPPPTPIPLVITQRVRAPGVS